MMWSIFAAQQQCHHRRDIALSQTLLYCLKLSSFFVLSLYTFVPSSVRKLPRDIALHIKWRSGVIVGVMILGVGMYPWLFCQNNISDSANIVIPWYRYLGWSWQPMQDVKIALHVLILYLGSLVCTWLKIYHHARIMHWKSKQQVLFPNQQCIRNWSQTKKKNSGKLSSMGLEGESVTKKLPIAPKPQYLWRASNQLWIQPTTQSWAHCCENDDNMWMKLRNFGIAPLAEEVVFRACLLPPLLASYNSASDGETTTSLTPTQASWIAPLFFGVAHLHHFYEQYRKLPSYQRTRARILQLMLGLIVQWTYTTLFGAYVSHVFVRTGSLSGVTLAHIICNYMGLPDVGFAHPTSKLHGYRWFIAVVYFAGIGLFAKGFSSELFPEKSVIQSLLQQDV